MPIDTDKYVRKPLYVDAVRVTEENFQELVQWCQGDIGYQDNRVVEGLITEIDPENQYIRIRVHNPQSPRQTRAFVGDWILYTDKGYKIYTEKAFTENFDPVDVVEEAPTE